MWRYSNKPLIVITNWRDGKHPHAGGAEMLCERLATNLVDRDYEVVLLASAVEDQPAVEQILGFTVIRRGGRFTVYAYALWWILLHRRKIYGVIDTQNGIPFFTPLVVKRKTPVLMLLLHIHRNQFELYFSPLMASIGKWLERSGSRLVYRHRTLIAISPSTRFGARRHLGLKGDIVVVPPGSEPSVTSPTAIRIRSENPRIVCVARLVPHKGTAMVIHAIAELVQRIPTIELHLVGDGPERRGLELLTSKLGLEIV